MYAFKCVIDSKNELKSICESQSKHIKFEYYKKRFDGEDYQREGNIYFVKSINHEMQTKSKPWE